MTAIVPPVRVQEAAFDPGVELNRFVGRRTDIGAIVAFTGLVRSNPGDPIVAMTLEHYQELAEYQLTALVAEARERFQLGDAMVIHRFGRLLPGEPIMQVVTSAAHRQAAFDGAAFLMDYLKTKAPFWKKEEGASGTTWVEAKLEDDEAQGRWEPESSQARLF